MAYRAAGPADGRAVLLVHGYPESSYMWRHVLPPLGDAGMRAVAPDLLGYGDSAPDPPGTWERHVDALQRFVDALDLAPVVLVTHDWGVMIGLRWACDHPGATSGLVISDGGFFADLHWHDLANVMRTPGAGEQLVGSYKRQAFGEVLGRQSPGMTDDALDEYWKGFTDETRRLGHLELYRSGDFEKLAAYEGRLGALGVPTLIMWGAKDRFATAKMAPRFQAELAGSEVAIFEDAGHFVWEDEPRQTTDALLDFLERRVRHASG